MSSQQNHLSEFESLNLEALFAEDLAVNGTTLTGADWVLTEMEVVLTLYVRPLLTVLGLLGKLTSQL